MGCGKLILQVLEEYPNLDILTGIELTKPRLTKKRALEKQWVELEDHKKTDLNLPYRTVCNLRLIRKDRSRWTSRRPQCLANSPIHGFLFIRLCEHTKTISSQARNKQLSSKRYQCATKKNKSSTSTRQLEFKLGNMFDFQTTIEVSDIVVCETSVPSDYHPHLLKLLRSMKKGARLLAYEDIEAMCSFYESWKSSPFVRLKINGTDDRFFTSWSPKWGHRFHLFERT